MYRKKKQVIQKLYKSACQQACENMAAEVSLLETLTTSEENLLQNSDFKDMLYETQRKQSLKSNKYINVTDSAFDFFKPLDRVVYNTENDATVGLHGCELYDYLMQSLKSNDTLVQSWVCLFSPNGESMNNMNL